ncbi:MAG TPA: DNA-processing protein DprA, partial [Actinotalea sp.]|nr:DNA-processing protein DprA [Actinotalea sp.]
MSGHPAVASAGDLDDVVLARVAFSRLVEPGDVVAGALLGALGPVEALDWVRAALARGSAGDAGLGRSDRGGVPGGTGTPGGVGSLGRPEVPEESARPGVPGVPGGSGGPDALDGLGATSVRRLETALRGWAPRWSGLDPRRDLAAAQRLGCRVLVPEAPGWPSRLDELGPAAPACLWQRGPLDLVGPLTRSVAVIGARACTAYGERVTATLAGGLADAGWA